jgi:ABC-type amino acid transport substrate-binding protein
MTKHIPLIAVFSVILALTAFGPTVHAAESLVPIDRILEKQEIRCGYTSWDPLFYVDVKTGEKKGIFHDLMEEAGKRLDLKIVWQEEIGWGSLTEALRTGRVDMVCAGYWLNPARIKATQSSVTQLYSPLYIYVNADEKRTIASPDALNTEAYTVGTIDGSAEYQIINKRFTKSKKISLPELGTSADVLMNLTSRKADFVILDSATASSYIAANPGKIKNLFPDQPMHMFPNVMLMPQKDIVLKNMIDNIFLDIERDGTLDIILKKYHSETMFLRNPQPR